MKCKINIYGSVNSFSNVFPFTGSHRYCPNITNGECVFVYLDMINISVTYTFVKPLHVKAITACCFSVKFNCGSSLNYSGTV